MRTLTANRLRELLDYNPRTGVFRWRIKATRHTVVGSRAGWVSRDFRLIGIDGCEYREHRLAWLHVHGHWPEHQIEHKNGNRADNRMANLREIIIGQNHGKAFVTSQVGLLGVSPEGQRYSARIKVGQHQHYLGQFDTPEDGHAAYLKAKRRLHPFWNGRASGR